jgi:16S rRNA (uracil1498-N3)-methyltransferase
LTRVTPRTAAAHVVVADLGDPELSERDRHHLVRVVRLRDGDVVTVTDGGGRWRPCRLRAGTLDVDGDVVAEPAPSPAITVAFAPVKGDRPEWVVQKLTEIGVDRIVPLRCERAVVRWPADRVPRQVDRLRRVAHEAVLQCRRVWAPEIAEPVDFAAALGWPGAAIAEPGGAPASLESPLLLVGPEGGWSPAELAAADVVGAPRIGLGPHVLRAETAAIVGAALLVALRQSGS